MEDMSFSKKRGRDESNELELRSQEVKRLKDDLLGFFDDSDLCNTTLDLDSFVKSFEDEISSSSPPPVTVVDLTSESGDSQPELGYLFEASDDELGLPPSTDVQNPVRVNSDTTEIGDLWGFNEEISGYDSFDVGFGEANGYTNNGDYVAFDGLFDNFDVGFGSSDFSWHTETLPAQ